MATTGIWGFLSRRPERTQGQSRCPSDFVTDASQIRQTDGASFVPPLLHFANAPFPQPVRLTPAPLPGTHPRATP